MNAKKKWKWGAKEQKAFEEIKAVISQETLLAFPDFTKTFHIYTDASDYQLGAVIMQEGKPLAFYSRKMTDAQKRYTTGEQELLSIIETLKEFRNILLGQQLVVHTDHKNIIYGHLSNDRIIRWRLLLEEYGPEYRHIKGKDNIVADALSRMEAKFNLEQIPSDEDDEVAHACMCAMTLSGIIRDEDLDDEQVYETIFANSNDSITEQFPLAPALICREQSRDRRLQEFTRTHESECDKMTLEGKELITFQGKILVPKILQGRIIAWYHEYLRHPGGTRLWKTINQTLTWKGLKAECELHAKTCRTCQKCKKSTKKYGKLPAKEAEDAVPWKRVNVDMIGPLTVGKGADQRQLNALTMIDPATGWFEVAPVEVIDSNSCQAAFDDYWLTRYPRPEFIGIDNGKEFKAVFEEM